MSAIESCRTAALGGHVARCENCSHTQISYNSCRNRHCPKCEGAAARNGSPSAKPNCCRCGTIVVLRCRRPSPTSPTRTRPSSTICCSGLGRDADHDRGHPKHLGAGSAACSSCIPGLRRSPSSARAHDRPGRRHLARRREVGLLPARLPPGACTVAIIRRLFLEKLVAAHHAGALQFFGNHAALTDAQAFAAYLAPLRNSEWVVYSKRPFGGPRNCCAISRDTPTALPSPTGV